MSTYINLDEWYFDKTTKSMINHNTGEIITNRNDIIKLLACAKNNVKTHQQLIKDAEAEMEVKNFLSENQANWKTSKKIHFIKLYRTERRNVLNKSNLSINASALLLYIEGYIEYPTNRIAKPNKTSFTNKDLMKLSKLGNVQLKQALNELEEKHFIKRTGKGKARQIYLNPYICSAGNSISKKTVEMFNSSYIPFTPY